MLLSPDTYIFINDSSMIVRISEGDGSNLCNEDIEEGLVDYIYYDCYDMDDDFENCDGGMVMLDKQFSKLFSSTSDNNCILRVLDMMGYENPKDVQYIVLKGQK